MSDEFDPYRKWLGIPAAEQPPNHYRLLAIAPFEDDPDVIEIAADQRMAHLRTLQTGPHAALSQKLLNELAGAKLCLLKPEEKAAYDANLRARFAASQPAAVSVGPPAMTLAQRMPHVSQPLVPVVVRVVTPPGQIHEPAPLIVTKNRSEPSSAGAGKPRFSRAASAWLALAAIAIPAAIFVGWLIWTKPDQNHARPQPDETASDGTARPAPKSPPPATPKEPGASPKGAPLASDGFVSLFNGKDLTGWKTHPNQPGNWRVENGILIGEGPATSYLVTERGNFTNFHLRVEARINNRGDSGVYSRAMFGPEFWPEGYEAQINVWEKGDMTGGLYGRNQTGPLVRVADSPLRANEWFTLETIAADNHIVVKVNGQTTADYVDSSRRFPMGHVALEKYRRETVVEFSKIEIRQNPPTPEAPNPPVSKPSELPEPSTPKPPSLASVTNQNDPPEPAKSGNEPRFPREIRGGTGGDWSIEGDELVRRPDFPEGTIVFGDPGWTDYDFSFDAKVQKGWFARIFFRYQDEKNFHSYGIGAWDNTWELVDTMEGGAWGKRQCERHVAIPSDAWQQIRISVRGEKGACFRNGKSVGEFSMPHLSKGRVGFVVEKKASYRFRNIVVKSPTGEVLLKGLPDVGEASVPDGRNATTEKPRSLGDLATDEKANSQKLAATEAFSLKRHEMAVTRIAFHRTLPVLASAGKDGRVLLWNLQSRALQGELHKFREEAWAIKFSPDGGLLAFANRNWWGSRLFVKTLAGQKLNEIKDFKNGGGAVASIAYSPDGRLFAAGQDDGTIRLWDVAQFREIAPVAFGEGHNIYGLAFGTYAVDRKRKRAEYLLAAAGQDGIVRTLTAILSNTNGGQWSFQQTKVQFPQGGAVIGLRFSPKGDLLGCTRVGGMISLFNPTTGENIRELARGGGSVEWLAFHPQQPWCLTAHKNAQVARIWSTSTAELLCELKGHTGGVMCAEFSPDGRHVATAAEDFSIKLWDLAGANLPAAPTRGKKTQPAMPTVGD